MRTTNARTLWGLIAVTYLSGGCMGRLIGEGVEGVLGPKGKYFEITPVANEEDHQALAAYGRFILGDVTNDCDSLLPGDFVDHLKDQFRRQLAESNLASAPSGKTLVFNVHIVHYEAAELEDNIFGPLEEVVATVTLVDQESDDIVAHGNAVGRTGKSVGLGTKSKAEGLAKALIQWAENYYPVPSEEDGD